MRRVRYRTVEEPSGDGKVYFRDAFVCDVGYRLHVMQEILDASQFTNPSESAAGLREISGNLSGRSDWFDFYDGEVRTLELSDKRLLDFFLKNTDGTIQGTGDFYGARENSTNE